MIIIQVGKPKKHVHPAAQGRSVRNSTKSERYDALSPEGKKIADAAEVLINTAARKITEKALDALDRIATKKKR